MRSAPVLPQDCPDCRVAPVIRHVGAHWTLACPKYQGLHSQCRNVGHTMLTKGAAIIEWNKLVPRQETR